MDASEDYTVLFDEYLKGNLSNAEVIEFENRLKVNEEFRRQFSLHQETLEGIDFHR